MQIARETPTGNLQRPLRFQNQVAQPLQHLL
jgi:hypothetical protein